MKRILSLVLCALLFASTVAFAQMPAVTPDPEFAFSVTKTIADTGDNADIGNRSAGSPAELESANFIEATMKEIGLQNVTVDEVTVDTWTFNRGRVYYNDANGEQQFMRLGGFATTLQSDMQTVAVVDGGRGTAADYEGLDVTGKVVLIDINQAEDWWVEIPSYEAYTRGALCVLVCNQGGYAYYDEDTVGSQDFCGPDYTPAFAVTQKDAKILRELIEAGNGEAEIVLDVDSVVTKDGVSRNIWGEIPGATDEVIYYFAHYDGYYHSFFDDASGVGSMLAIAKAMVESGEKPERTIRFVAHGAEEWGATDTEYDWSQGAFKQITQVHPEWADNAFAILNIDGMYPVEGHVNFAVAATYELATYAQQSEANAIYADGADYTLDVTMPTTCWTEDFSYVRAGVPSIVASHAEPEEVYHGPAYHSDKDNVALGVNMDAWQLSLNLFAGYASELDGLAVRPVDFTTRIIVMQEVYTGEENIDFARVIAAGEALNKKIAAMNAAYAEAVAAGDTEKAAQLRSEAIDFNARMVPVFKAMVAATIGFDWEDNTVFAFELTQNNVEALTAAIDCLNSSDAQTALDEHLCSVDYNWYAFDFSKETYTYMLDKMFNKAAGTWGEGLIRFPGEDLWDVIDSLKTKAEAGETDFSAEIAVLEEALATQLDNQKTVNTQVATDLDAVAEMIENLAK